MTRKSKRPEMLLASSHEEANIIIKHEIFCGHDTQSKMCVILDDTDLFAILSYHNRCNKLQC